MHIIFVPELEMSVMEKMRQFVRQHHWKVLNIVCCAALTWQMCGIFSEWLHPTQETVRITQKKLSDIQFPLTIKICPDPGFNYTAVEEAGYNSITDYFRGRSEYTHDKHVMTGWAGHTKSSETRGTVDEVYQRVANYPSPEDLFERYDRFENDKILNFINIFSISNTLVTNEWNFYEISSAQVVRPNYPSNCFTWDIFQEDTLDGVAAIGFGFKFLPGTTVEILLEDKRLSCIRPLLENKFYSSGSDMKVDLGNPLLNCSH